MYSFLKKFTPLLMVCLAGFFISCNNNSDSKTSTENSTADTAVAAVAAPEVFEPFDVAEISHVVKDYAKWRPAFNTDSVARKASGLETIVVGRGLTSPNSLLVVLKVSDISKAKAFAADPRLKEVMQKNGVISKPSVKYYHVIRFNPESKEKQWVLVDHKVKDFDAWLKVFDEEGTVTRASFGLADVVLARDVDNPNMIHIVFDIKDMAKAKARMTDPALKKLMTDAGVEGVPKITFYSSAE
ncbi:MAG: hypothetical protein ABI415_00550 [Flavitalea sp.]